MVNHMIMRRGPNSRYIRTRVSAEEFKSISQFYSKIFSDSIWYLLPRRRGSRLYQGEWQFC